MVVDSEELVVVVSYRAVEKEEDGRGCDDQTCLCTIAKSRGSMELALVDAWMLVAHLKESFEVEMEWKRKMYAPSLSLLFE